MPVSVLCRARPGGQASHRTALCLVPRHQGATSYRCPLTYCFTSPHSSLEEVLNEEWAAMLPKPDLDLSNHDHMVLLLGGNTLVHPILAKWPPLCTEDYLSDRDKESVNSKLLEDELSNSCNGSLLLVKALSKQKRVPFQFADSFWVAAFFPKQCCSSSSIFGGFCSGLKLLSRFHSAPWVNILLDRIWRILPKPFVF